MLGLLLTWNLRHIYRSSMCFLCEFCWVASSPELHISMILSVLGQTRTDLFLGTSQKAFILMELSEHLLISTVSLSQPMWDNQINFALLLLHIHIVTHYGTTIAITFPSLTRAGTQFTQNLGKTYVQGNWWDLAGTFGSFILSGHLSNLVLVNDIRTQHPLQKRYQWQLSFYL